MDNFPSNAHSSRRERFERDRNRTEEDPKADKVVVTGKVIRRKKSLGTRFKESFFGGDTQGVLGYIVFEIAIPMAKDIIIQMANEGLNRALWQGRERPAASRYSSGPIIRRTTDYGSYSRSSDRDRREVSRREKHTIDDIYCESRDEAHSVLDAMDRTIEKYKSASLSDLYSYLGITPDFTDDRWGWTADTFRRAKVVETREGFWLDLPPTELIV